jgi:hypothetical protein
VSRFGWLVRTSGEVTERSGPLRAAALELLLGGPVERRTGYGADVVWCRAESAGLPPNVVTALATGLSVHGDAFVESASEPGVHGRCDGAGAGP